MIPLHKFAGLPVHMRHRKAAKIFGEAEQRFAVSGQLSSPDAEYLGRLTELLLGEDCFGPAAVDALKEAGGCFSSMQDNGRRGKSEPAIRRALNTARYVMLSVTGQYKSDWDFVAHDGGLDPSKRQPFPGMQVYLEDIRSPFNVGSMFRTAESFGAEKIWLSPLCANPRHKRAERTAMGCVDVIPWEQAGFNPFINPAGPEFAGQKDSESTPRSFPPGPFFALETGGIPLPDFSFPDSGVLIAGSEELGVSPEALAAADSSLGRVSIPVRGVKGSLNVSVAFGIVMQAWSQKRQFT